MFKKMKTAICGAVAGTAALLSATPGFCELTYTVPEVDVTNLGTMVTSILAGLAAIWGIRKVIKVINRS